jgi:hypothetical protein
MASTAVLGWRSDADVDLERAHDIHENTLSEEPARSRFWLRSDTSCTRFRGISMILRPCRLGLNRRFVGLGDTGVTRMFKPHKGWS